MDIKKILETLSPNERKILPYLDEKIEDICKKSNLDKTSVIRALKYLENKKIIETNIKEKKIIDVGVNGALYRRKGLPERRLLNALDKKRILRFNEAKKEASLNDDELKASIGVLKRKGLIEIKKDKIILKDKKEIYKKMPEELFLESLPIELDSLTSEQAPILKELKKRREIIEIKANKIIEIKITNLGKEVIKRNIKPENLIEQINSEIIKKELWRGKKFRRYNLVLPLSKIHGGKKHFVNQAIEYARKIWLEMGFKEMSGPILISSFWNFDALFTPQDHPVREMQDTFFIPFEKKDLAEKKIVKAVQKAHEKGVAGSRGWQYKWDEKKARRLILRTHTTCISSQTLTSLKQKDLPAKFFAIGKCFRNETLDWSHGFEFNQTEGIVIDENANFRHLLGYLKEFFKKMGFEKIKFTPAYFPYTEPSVEINVWHPEKKCWLELGGAGIFRPEVTVPLLGKNIPVLAWGPGFDRILMDYYKIDDIRELYKNDLNTLREIKFWMK